ncbi:MAG: hypothetical protein H8D34_33100 [Chloroflexi bacterium]|nr:hypothetical protein [Chloroflexota bacterium]
MKNKSKRYKGISRIHLQSTNGWLVCDYKRGHSHSKFFHDNRFGGWETALKAAVTYRDEANLVHSREEVPFVTGTTGTYGAKDRQNLARTTGGKQYVEHNW